MANPLSGVENPSDEKKNPPTGHKNSRRKLKISRRDLARHYKMTVRTVSTLGFGSLEQLDLLIRSRVSALAADRAVKLKEPFGDPDLNLRWRSRYPVWTAFRCCQEGCLQVLLYEGYCDQHGGPPAPPLRLRPEGVELLLGKRRYVPYGLLVAGGLRTDEIHYIDGNGFNCRPKNLKLLVVQVQETEHPVSAQAAPAEW